jgi:hypothetical protein
MLSGGLGQTSEKGVSCFENGGIIHINPMLGEKGVKGAGELREFLWKHWIQRKRGIIATMVNPIDGAKSSSCYFIQPSGENVWQIVIEVHRKSGESVQDVVRFFAYNATRIEIAADGFSERVEIGKDVVRRPESYRLSLKDRQGAVLEEL